MARRIDAPAAPGMARPLEAEVRVLEGMSVAIIKVREPIPPPTRRDPPMNRPRLLVVDDDPYTRSALHALFTRQGWHVLLAATVAEGLALLDPAPCCVVLDLNLPDGG